MCRPDFQRWCVKFIHVVDRPLRYATANLIRHFI